MRTLHVITGLSGGGAERALYNLLSGGLGEYAGRGVLSLTDGGVYGAPIRDLGVPVYELNIRRRPDRGLGASWIKAVVRDFQPDIIQGWMYHGNLAAVFAARFALGQTALVWNVRHSLYVLRAEKPLTRQVIRINKWFSRSADAIVYNSRLARKQHEEFGFEADRGLVIPNGFDIDALQPDMTVGLSVRRLLGIPGDALVVGHVARFHPMKDHVSFLRAAARVAQEVTDARFVLIGRGIDESNRTLVGLIPEELKDRFYFLGERNDVHDLMQAMDVFCTSSAWGEGFPNVLGEAMACGVPCVATDVGDSAAIVGDTGVVVPASDSAALADGILSVISGPVDKRHGLGRASRARIGAKFRAEDVMQRYADLYRDLSNGREGRCA